MQAAWNVSFSVVKGLLYTLINVIQRMDAPAAKGTAGNQKRGKGTEMRGPG
jgi:hypothetical protein